MMDELVSIIMPTYNCERFIGESIESVLAQTYPAWELIIVDDCSKDNTKGVVEKYISADNRIVYHRLEPNLGAAAARNKAMEFARGKYMAFLDSDDLWTPDKLDKQLAFMKQNKFNFTCTAYEQIDELGKPLHRTIKTKVKTNYNGLLLSCPVGNSTVLYNAEAMGRFTVPNIRKRNDDALWLQMLKKEEFIYGLPDVLMQYRVRSSSISHNKIQLIKYHWILYRQIEHLSVVRSTFHVCFWVFLKAAMIK